MNDRRKELGLAILDNNWKLDSIEYIDQNNIYYPYSELAESKFWYQIKNNKHYCQHWSNATKDTLNPCHKSKRIFYIRSIWLWKNKLEAECDDYINPKSKLEYVELNTVFDFQKKKWFSEIDTLETEFKMERDLKRADGLGLWLCGTGLFNYDLDTIGLSKPETDKILKRWKLK
jgi:hypothetical protein